MEVPLRNKDPTRNEPLYYFSVRLSRRNYYTDKFEPQQAYQAYCSLERKYGRDKILVWEINEFEGVSLLGKRDKEMLKEKSRESKLPRKSRKE